MTQEYYSIITNQGLAKHAAASLGGAPINLTHLAAGDANGVSHNPVATATALHNELCRVAITYVVLDENNPNQLIVEAIIDETVGPFYIREVGIFDAAGDLFAIGKFPETFKPNLPSGSGKRLYVRMILGFASAPQVNLIISDDINNDPNFSTNVFNSLSGKLAKSQNLADLTDVAQARTNLGYSNNLLAASDFFSNKNIIINGNFNIWQRGTSFLSAPAGTFAADRWSYFKVGSMVHDLSRSSDVPTVLESGKLFNYSLLIDCTTPDSSIAASEYCTLLHRIEGYNFAPLAQKTITLSFWVKATKTGIYNIGLQSIGNDRSCVKEYVINASDVWEFKTLTFPPSPASGGWNYTNGGGLDVSFVLAMGSNMHTSSNVWQNGDYFATPNQVNACDSAANNFRICGVQLELGSIATPFENISIGQQIALCQRYYEKSYDVEEAPGTINPGGSVRGFPIANTVFRRDIPFKIPKRVPPTLAYYNPSTGAIGQILFGWGGGSSTTSVLYEDIGTTKWTGGTNFTQSVYNDASFHWTANAELS